MNEVKVYNAIQYIVQRLLKAYYSATIQSRTKKTMPATDLEAFAILVVQCLRVELDRWATDSGLNKTNGTISGSSNVKGSGRNATKRCSRPLH